MRSSQTVRLRIDTLVLAALLAVAPLTAQAPAASSPGTPHPLAPPDRSSPRATLETLLESVDKAVALYQAGDPAFRRPYAVAQGCIDPSRLAPRTAERASGEATLLLKEVLDRLELPPRSEIPDASRVAEEGLTAWRVPHTEIEIVKMEEGDRAGQFLFSAATVERTAEFFERVRHLPYQPGKRGTIYEEFRFGSKSKWISALVARLPAWTKREIGGQATWQWVGLGLVLIAAGTLVLVALRAGRKYTRPVAESRGLNRLWAFLGPVALIAIPLVVRRASFEQLTIWGAPGLYLRLALTLVAMLGGAWLTVVVVTRGAEYLVRGLALERPLSQQLIRVSSRALALVLVLAWVFFAGQRLGLPVTAMVAGLGVGGLAVALAAKSTLENLIAGISLYADQPVRIGESVQMGDEQGCLEEVGLRSTKIRRADGTLLTMPNAEFAGQTLVNLSRREKTEQGDPSSPELPEREDATDL